VSVGTQLNNTCYRRSWYCTGKNCWRVKINKLIENDDGQKTLR